MISLIREATISPIGHIVDRVLAERARERITASDSMFGEKAAATAVWAAMKAKTKLGMGMKR